MFFYLSKLITVFIDPLFVFLLILTILTLKIRQNKLVRGVIFTGSILLSILATEYVANRLFQTLENSVPRTELNQSYDAVVVLSGMVHLNVSDKNNIEFSGAVDRILKGIELVKTGVARKLLISGGTGSLTDPSKSEADLLAIFALKQGIPKSKIIIEARSRNTYENAVETAKLVKYHRLNSLILVTSAFHMYRSLGSFSQAGQKVTPLSVDIQSGLDRDDFRNFFPSVDGLYTLKRVIHEVVGIISYGLLGKAKY